MVVDSPGPTETLNLATVIRKPIAFDIQLQNPLEESIVFEVFIDGKDLIGENHLYVEPKSVQQYELIFMPLSIFKASGTVGFLHKKLGEIWYDLRLQSEETSTIRLPVMKCELGKTEKHEIQLENPSDKPV